MFQLASIHLLSRRDASHQLDERLSLPKAANVNQITMFCPCLLDLRLESTTASLTDVSLKQCPIDFVIEFLLRCPNLIDFHCWSHGPPSKVKDPRIMLTSPLVLNQLSSLTWSAGKRPYLSEWCNALFECVRFPALKKFSWGPGQRSYMDNLAELLPLFKFPNSVTTLQLDWIGFISTDATLNHFSALTDLTQLRFSNCDSFFVERAFTILSWGTGKNDISFPKLTALIIDYNLSTAATAWMVFHVESGKNLVGMLRRRMGLIDKFTLTVVTARMTHHWDGETWDALRELKKDGLDLTIAEGGHSY
ncbi:hypothetical protein AGABI2DRAFT_119018 [Agaricus bisporus var. bisporus H97]|uniref:hypothetical protein n=1 Tax=Agaricus bisporus var. bisporus (strain H97 / ATCC MYA-4626 / FGSC 10389) TaxID=936046 RepID=UPI00029F7AD2|nr:hypothetical protein AGABI2DRAFT_119018 [Agaricus bisporus var. bisporus H97]EKV46836.1 hypothetical protein AGABI2DRAFT_119018 [Agaricus bisporus var. bisporus H97]